MFATCKSKLTTSSFFVPMCQNFTRNSRISQENLSNFRSSRSIPKLASKFCSCCKYRKGSSAISQSLPRSQCLSSFFQRATRTRIDTHTLSIRGGLRQTQYFSPEQVERGPYPDDPGLQMNQNALSGKKYVRGSSNNLKTCSILRRQLD